jgi:phenylacetate-CoA ligase
MSESEAPRLTVIAPCLDEELNVPVLVARVLASFERLPIQAELVLIDDGSRDATWQRIQEASAADRRVRGVRHDSNLGIVEGWVSGLGVAAGELVCLIDSDLQNRPEDIPRLYEAYARGQAHVAQGVRHPKGSRERVGFSRALNFLLNASFGTRLRDNKSGFILCARSTLEEVLRGREGYRYFQSFLGVSAHLRGFRITEVDTDFEPRVAGESFLARFPLRVSLRVLLELVRYRAATLPRSRHGSL